MFTKLKYKKITASSLITTLFAVSGYSLIEPTFLAAQSDSDSVNVTMTINSEITINSPSDATLGPALSLSNNEANAETTWNVKTNDTDGYNLSVNASQSGALASASDSFTDYTESVSGTPETWSVTGDYQFGFSAHGTDVSDGTWGTSDSCGTNGPQATDKNYRGFDGTTPIQIANATSETAMAGTDSTVCYAAEQDTVLAPSGAYTATITATATVN